MLDGVRNSADMEEKTGTRLGGLGELTAAASTSRTVSSGGCTPSWMVMRSVSSFAGFILLQAVEGGDWDTHVRPFWQSYFFLFGGKKGGKTVSALQWAFE